MRKTVVFTGVLAAALAGPVAGGAASAPSPAPSPAAVVHVKDFAYHAVRVSVHVGDTVKFVNDDGDAHTVTASDKTFDSGGLDTGESWSRTFTKPGTYAYFCALHPYMKGIVVVLPAGKDAQ
jgi:plastocyanin